MWLIWAHCLLEKRGQFDVAREVKSWSREFGITRAQLQQIGNSAAAVSKELTR